MSRLPDVLSTTALVYLAAPAFVFLLGWLELPLGLATVALLSVALVQLAVRLPSRPFSYSSIALVFLLSLALAWSSLGGAGHLVYANIDWQTRDAVYADLIFAQWPPSYGLLDGAPLVLRTAMGYFLLPAALTKIAGIEWATTILLAWTATGAGLFLLLLPFPEKLGWRLTLLASIVIFFSGMDYLGSLMVHGHAPIFPLPLEWWRQWTFSSLTAQLFWAPNHALGLWLGAALFFRHRSDTSLGALALVMLPLLLLWTPFAVIGLLPWLAWSIFQEKYRWLDAIRCIKPAQWLCGLVLSLVVASLFSRQGVSTSFAPHAASVGPAGKLGDFDLELALAYIQFAGCEFMLLALLLMPFVGTLRREFLFTVGLLICIPLVRFGPSNDWSLRVSTPSLVILMIILIDALNRHLQERKEIRKLLPLLLVLLLGALTPLFEFSRAILWRQTPPNYGESVVENQHGFLAPHYIGLLDRRELQTMFRKPGLVPNAQERQARLPPELRRHQ